MSKLLTAAVAAAVLAALVAGCGGGGGGDTTAETAALTKAEFIKQGDAICKETGDQSEKEAEEFAEENGFTLEKANEQQLEEAVAAVLVTGLRQQAEELDALGAPKGDEGKIEEIITSLEDATDEIEGDPAIVFKEEVFDEPNELAQDYGFKVCGEE